MEFCLISKNSPELKNTYNSFLIFAKKIIMIQRIQSVYLFLAFILTGSLFFYPLANFIKPTGDSLILDIVALKSFEDGMNSIMSAYPLAILTGTIVALLALTIFLYKKRALQARLSIIVMILLAGLCGMIYLYISMSAAKVGLEPEYTMVDVFPVISIILVFIARRRIRIDDALVKSYDRIR